MDIFCIFFLYVLLVIFIDDVSYKVNIIWYELFWDDYFMYVLINVYIVYIVILL